MGECVNLGWISTLFLQISQNFKEEFEIILWEDTVAQRSDHVGKQD